MEDDMASLVDTINESNSDAESVLDEEDPMAVDTEADEETEDSDEEDVENNTKSGLILTEMSTEAMEAEHEGDSNSSSSNSDGKSDEKEDDDSRGSKKPSKSPDLSPPMSRKRRIQDVAPADDNKTHTCNLPTDLEIREGSDFQAPVPDYIERSSAERESEVEKEKCHWLPSDSNDDEKTDAFCTLCEVKYGLNRHQSLYMLHKASNDIEKAKELCSKRANFKGEWSSEDKQLFQHCLNVFGKNFSRIKNAMPHKTTAALVQHYYETKKTHSTKSSFDVDHAHRDEEDNESEESSDNEEDQNEGDAGSSTELEGCNNDSQDSMEGEEVVCTNCGHHVNKLHDLEYDKLCTSCYFYLIHNHDMRPCQEINENHHRKCPPEMADVVLGFYRHVHILEETENVSDKCSDLPKVYQGRKYVVDQDLRNVNKNLNEVHARIAQVEKKINDFDFRKVDKDVENFRKIASFTHKPSKSRKTKDHWTDREMTIAFHVLVLYGDDYSRVTKFIRTKNVAQVKEFAEKHRRDLLEIKSQSQQPLAVEDTIEVDEEDPDGPPVLTKEEFYGSSEMS